MAGLRIGGSVLLERLRRYEPDVKAGDKVGFYVYPMLPDDASGLEGDILRMNVRAFGGEVVAVSHEMAEEMETWLCVDMRELGKLILPANCFEWREGGEG